MVFSKNSSIRYEVRDRLIFSKNKKGFVWFLDQHTFDDLIKEQKLNSFGMKYSDFRCRLENKIWTGKGNRKFKKKKNKKGFSDVIEEYKSII